MKLLLLSLLFTTSIYAGNVPIDLYDEQTPCIQFMTNAPHRIKCLRTNRLVGKQGISVGMDYNDIYNMGKWDTTNWGEPDDIIDLRTEGHNKAKFIYNKWDNDISYFIVDNGVVTEVHHRYFE